MRMAASWSGPSGPPNTRLRRDDPCPIAGSPRFGVTFNHREGEERNSTFPLDTKIPIQAPGTSLAAGRW